MQQQTERQQQQLDSSQELTQADPQRLQQQQQQTTQAGGDGIGDGAMGPDDWREAPELAAAIVVNHASILQLKRILLNYLCVCMMPRHGPAGWGCVCRRPLWAGRMPLPTQHATVCQQREHTMLSLAGRPDGCPFWRGVGAAVAS